MEEWKIIQTNPLYSISSLGRIKNNKTGRILKLYTNKYHRVFYRRFNIAREVAKAFIPLVKGKDYVNHKDGDPTNNYVNNLEWVNRSENEKHAFANGLKTPTRGERSGMAKATNELVDYIRSHYIPYDKEWGTRGLARKTGLSKSTVQYITAGKTWVAEIKNPTKK